jgi:hypothetical protein
MTRTRVLAAVTAALLAAPVAAQAAGPRATVRAMTATQTVLPGDQAVGAARAYLDGDGVAHALSPNTVLGQLVAGAALEGADLGIGFNPQFGGFVNAIGGIAPANPDVGSWSLFIDNALAATGAETATIKKGQEVVWILDPDFTTPGPTFLDLDPVRAAAVPGTFWFTFAVTLAGGEKPVPAKGATVILNGRPHKVNARGRVTIEVRQGADWTARATLKGSIRSETLRGTAG